jgi:hypothetical protein
MPLTISLTAEILQTLDLSPAEAVIEPLLSGDRLQQPETCLRFEIDFPRPAEDPRELSEVAEVRLWFIRLDSRYPWLPLYLDRETSELARYTAMLVPHQFSPLDGIRYNPEALEIFVMGKIFVIDDWLKARQIQGRQRLKQMMQTLGYDIDEGLFSLLSTSTL